jgi:hypothetical protein
MVHGKSKYDLVVNHDPRQQSSRLYRKVDDLVGEIEVAVGARIMQEHMNILLPNYLNLKPAKIADSRRLCVFTPIKILNIMAKIKNKIKLWTRITKVTIRQHYRITEKQIVVITHSYHSINCKTEEICEPYGLGL